MLKIVGNDETNRGISLSKISHGGSVVKAESVQKICNEKTA